MINMLLVGCSGDTKSALGLKKSAPDEFMVISNPPLSVPPDFILSNPTEPKKEILSQATLEPQKNSKPDKSDQEFLNKLGAKEQATPSGKLVDEEYQQAINKRKEKGFIRKTVSTFHDESDKVIDPVTEKERIKNNLKEGKPINEGEVQNKSTSTLDKIFN